jgi:hypothetical protein
MPRHDPKSASFSPFPSSVVLSMRIFSGWCVVGLGREGHIRRVLTRRSHARAWSTSYLDVSVEDPLAVHVVERLEELVHV